MTNYDSIFHNLLESRKYVTVVYDPPWKCNKNHSHKKRYKTLSIEPVSDVAADSAESDIKEGG